MRGEIGFGQAARAYGRNDGGSALYRMTTAMRQGYQKGRIILK